MTVFARVSFQNVLDLFDWESWLGFTERSQNNLMVCLSFEYWSIINPKKVAFVSMILWSHHTVASWMCFAFVSSTNMSELLLVPCWKYLVNYLLQKPQAFHFHQIKAVALPLKFRILIWKLRFRSDIVLFLVAIFFYWPWTNFSRNAFAFFTL